MTLRVVPSVESMVVAVLRADTDLDDIVGTRIGTELYAGVAAAVQVHLVSGEERVRHHLDAARVQIDGWGGSKLDAWNAVSRARAVLLGFQGVVTGLGVMSGARTLTTPQWLPDDTFEPPRARYTCDLEVYVHPLLP